MKRIFLALLVLGATLHAQNIRYDSDVTQPATNVPSGAAAAIYTVPNAQVYICAYPWTGQPCSNTVPVYSDIGGTDQLGQPLQADNRGRFGFWIPSGQYSYSVLSKSGQFLGTFPLTLTSPTGAVGPPGPSGSYTQAGFLNVVAYGSSFAAMMTDPSTQSSTITVSYTTPLPNGTTTVSADRNLLALGGGQFTCPSGTCTLALSGGDFDAPLNKQVFGSNVIVTGLKHARPEWFGTNGITPTLISSLVSTGAQIDLQAATYSSAFTATPGACIQKPNISIVGAKQPSYNSLTAPTALTNGTIIQGGLHVCGADNFSVSNVGFDVGSAYVTGGGAAGDGINVNGLTGGSTLSDPIVNKASLTNVSCLLNTPSAAFHCALVEHINGATLQNISTFYGTHGLAFKSINSTLRGLNSKACASDCLVIKADSYTATGNLQVSQINIAGLSAGQVANGIVIDAENNGSVSNIEVSDATVTSAINGIQLLGNSSVTAGSLQRITISGATLNMTATGGPTPSCMTISGSGGDELRWAQFNNFTCLNGTGGGAFSPVQDYLPSYQTIYSNWLVDGSVNSSTLTGYVFVNGWTDVGTGAAGATFNANGSTTKLYVAGYSSSRPSSTVWTTSTGAVAYVLPYAQDADGQMVVSQPIRGAASTPITIAPGASATTSLVVQNATKTTNLFTVLNNGNATLTGNFSSPNTPQVGTPTTGKAACVKSAGPPVLLGYCSTVVDSGGACTCN